MAPSRRFRKKIFPRTEQECLGVCFSSSFNFFFSNYSLAFDVHLFQLKIVRMTQNDLRKASIGRGEKFSILINFCAHLRVVNSLHSQVVLLQMRESKVGDHDSINLLVAFFLAVFT